MNLKFYKNFDLYSRALMGSKDVDPTYPVIKSIVEKEGFDPQWFAFVYVAFYNLETAIKMCRCMPNHTEYDPLAFQYLRQTGELKKFGHERRGTARNIETQMNNFEHICHFLDFTHGRTDASNPLWNDCFYSQEDFRTALQTLPFHGGWASFKIAEIFEKSFGYKQFTIPDLGVVGRDPNSNDGPVGGLRHLYGREHNFDESWYGIWDDFGSKLASAWGVDIGMIETCLCKFHKLVSGKYHVGHDIEELVELRHVLDKTVYHDIMSENFDEYFWAGVSGVRKEHKNLYATTGQVINSEFARYYPEVDVLELILQ